jgi:hypothetical protein
VLLHYAVMIHRARQTAQKKNWHQDNQLQAQNRQHQKSCSGDARTAVLVRPPGCCEPNEQTGCWVRLHPRCHMNDWLGLTLHLCMLVTRSRHSKVLVNPSPVLVGIARGQ